MAIQKLHVRLWEARGAGIVLERPTGVVYQNQVAGHACMQEELEGVYAPLDGDVDSLEATLLKHFTGPYHGGWSRPLREEDADFIDAALDRADPVGRQVRVDRARLGESCEAWVWVEVRVPDTENQFPVVQFEGQSLKGALTWSNSD